MGFRGGRFGAGYGDPGGGRRGPVRAVEVVRGLYAVRYPQTLGRVERIFCNRAGEPQYVRVRAGLFGKRLVLIPVMDVAIDYGHRAITLR